MITGHDHNDGALSMVDHVQMCTRSTVWDGAVATSMRGVVARTNTTLPLRVG
jgi:hypothetical protein